MSGILFIFAAATFLLGWFLMPDAGTNDAKHILEAIGSHRGPVWWSVVVHLLCSLALAGAVVNLRLIRRPASSHLTSWGSWLVFVGAMGVCLDGFFHLVAFYFTAPGVQQREVLEPMRLLQTQGIVLLIPFLLALFAGGPLLSIGLQREQLVTPWPLWCFLLAISFAVCGGCLAAVSEHGRQKVALGFITLISLAYAWLGSELAQKSRTIRN